MKVILKLTRAKGLTTTLVEEVLGAKEVMEDKGVTKTEEVMVIREAEATIRKERLVISKEADLLAEFAVS